MQKSVNQHLNITCVTDTVKQTYYVKGEETKYIISKEHYNRAPPPKNTNKEQIFINGILPTAQN